MIIGKQSILFDDPVYIEQYASVVGKKEGEGPIGDGFDEIIEDPMLGMNTWEEAESKLQERAINRLFEKTAVGKGEVRYIFAGDLLGQLIATSYGLEKYRIPVFGLYGACSTFGEALSLGAMTLSGGFADNVIAVASSHFASAEKQFRFPLEYGNQRPPSSTWTVTGCGAVMLSRNLKEDKRSVRGVKIRGITTGHIVDYGIKDSMNMGACMAPAAADLIAMNMKDFGIQPQYYDMIITGDLGRVGRSILFELLKEKGYDIKCNYTDCGIEMFDPNCQNTKAGGSGCGCSATVFCSYIMSNIVNGRWKKVLFIPTGSLQSTVSYNEGKSIPGIAHGVMIEGCDDGIY